MIDFEYVMSAPGRLGIFDSATRANPAFLQALMAYLGLQKQFRPDDSKMAILFNAYTEPAFLDHLNDFNRLQSEDRYYIDSGGLQIVTTGASITDDIKKQIWTVQAKANGYAMCFDEMPLHIDGGASKRGDTSNRILIDSKIEEAGSKTGINVEQQINLFKELGTDSKSMVIAQGQSLETYQRYINGILSQVSPSNYDKIQGLSLSFACFGSNKFANIDVFNSIRRLQVPDEFKHHIHLLGAGSLQKIIPGILLYKSGFLDKFKLSYDSTTHSASYDMGSYTIRDKDQVKLYTIGKERTDLVDKVYFENIYTPAKLIWDKLGFKDFEDFMQATIYTDNEKLKGLKPAEIKAYSKQHSIAFPLIKFIYIHSQIMDFNKNVQDLISGDLKIDAIVRSKDQIEIWNNLSLVKDEYDFDEFKKQTRRYFMDTTPNIRKYDSMEDFYVSEKAFGELF